MTAVTPAPPVDPAVRRRLGDELAAKGAGWLLWAWREAARGDDVEELALLWVLHGARIGSAAPEATVADELDGRLAAVERPPAVMPQDVAEAERSWRADPTSQRKARRWWRLATASGRPPVASDPHVLDLPVEHGPSLTEAAHLVLADALSLASGREDLTVVDAARRLAAVEERFGRVVPPATTGPPLAEVLRGGGDAADVRAAYVSHRQQVLTRLLRAVAPAPDDDDREDGDVRRRLRRVLVGFAVSAAVAAVIAVLPRSVPALPDDDLVRARADAIGCSSCPPDEQVVGVGWQIAEERVRITIELAAAPETAALTVLLGDGRSLTLERADDRWRLGAPGDPGFRVDRAQVLSDGSTVVVDLPRSADPAGIAVTSASGDRLPADGFAPAAPDPSTSVNVVDLAIVAFLALAARRGLRAGLIATMPALAGFVLTFAAARLLYPPVGALLLDRLTDLPRLANSVAVAVLLAVIGSGLYLVGGAAVSAGLRRLVHRLPVKRGTSGDRWLGAAGRALRATATLATTLTLAVNLAAVTWLAGLVRESLLGQAVVGLWRSVFPGL